MPVEEQSRHKLSSDIVQDARSIVRKIIYSGLHLRATNQNSSRLPIKQDSAEPESAAAGRIQLKTAIGAN